jgi:hypothetical protein
LASKPEVGSSKNITWGFDMISIPIHNLFASPPDIPLYNVDPTGVF